MKKLMNDFLRFRYESKKYASSAASFWKYYKPWKRTLDRSKTSLYYRLPWITFPAITFLEQELKKEDHVFEFGGGGSSLFFLEKGCRVTTVEHHETWFREISAHIAKMGFKDLWQGHFVTPEQNVHTLPQDPSDPLAYYSAHNDHAKDTFKAYASRIDEEADKSLDVVLVDGRVRPSCILHAVPKIKAGGLLVIDNTERDYYSEYFLKHLASRFTLEMDGFGPVPYITWFNKTTIWRKKQE
jgi:precorrin-6B methylase 2